jgi:hypothetical protein
MLGGSLVSTLVAAGGTGFPPVDQHYLFQARQMQALSLAVHIPLVCFGISFPAMVLFAEWRYLRTGDPLYRTLARRWSKVMLALFAVGVVTGTILSFEFGLLWPGLTAAFGKVFGLGFALEGFSFFVEAIFIAINVYGWDRLSPRVNLLSGIPSRSPGSPARSSSSRSTAGCSTPPGSWCGTAGRSTRTRGRPCSRTLLLARVRPHVLRRLHRRRSPPPTLSPPTPASATGGFLDRTRSGRGWRRP